MEVGQRAEERVGQAKQAYKGRVARRSSTMGSKGAASGG